MNELAIRTLTGLILIVTALLVAFQGGYLLAIVIAGIATAMFYEWTRLTRGWGAFWYIGGFIYALLPALALSVDPRTRRGSICCCGSSS